MRASRPASCAARSRSTARARRMMMSVLMRPEYHHLRAMGSLALGEKASRSVQSASTSCLGERTGSPPLNPKASAKIFEVARAHVGGYWFKVPDDRRRPARTMWPSSLTTPPRSLARGGFHPATHDVVQLGEEHGAKVRLREIEPRLQTRASTRQRTCVRSRAARTAVGWENGPAVFDVELHREGKPGKSARTFSSALSQLLRTTTCSRGGKAWRRGGMNATPIMSAPRSTTRRPSRNERTRSPSGPTVPAG
jgi:hypothetical protein